MLVTGSFDTTHLVFWVGPMVGGWVGGMVYSYVLRNNRCDKLVFLHTDVFNVIICSQGSLASQEDPDV